MNKPSTTHNDSFQETVATAVAGQTEVRLKDIATKLDLGNQRAAMIRVAICLRNLGWQKHRTRDGGYVYTAVSPAPTI